MNCARPLIAALVALALLGGAADAHAQSQQKQATTSQPKLYRWVDKNGQVHYGDKVPPEYAGQDRDVLNRQGLRVGREAGSATGEEARARAERARQAAAEAEQARRDRMLLQTYQDLGEIELLRNRRLDIIDSQLTIQQQSLNTLRARHADQLRVAGRYAPYNTADDAPELPEGLAADIAQSESDIRVAEDNLRRKREERVEVDRQFDEDARRFQELRRRD